MKSGRNSVVAVANRILASDGNLIKLILAVLIFVAVAMLPSFASSGILYLLGVSFDEQGYAIMPDVASAAISLFVIAAYIFIVLPALSGVFMLARRIAVGEGNSLEVLLTPFRTARNYFRSLLVAVFVLLELALPLLVIIGGASLSVSVFSGQAEKESLLVIPAAVFLVCAVIAATVAALYASSFLLFSKGLILDGERPMRALRTSVTISREKRGATVRLMILWLIMSALSLLTLGILFVIYVAPFVLVSYFVLLNERKILRLSCLDGGMEKI